MINIQVLLHVRIVAHRLHFIYWTYLFIFQDFYIVEFDNLYLVVHNPSSFTVLSWNIMQTSSKNTMDKTQPYVKLWSQDKVKNINTAAAKAIEHIFDDLVRWTRDLIQNNISETCDICVIFSNASKETFGVIYLHLKTRYTAV